MDVYGMAIYLNRKKYITVTGKSLNTQKQTNHNTKCFNSTMKIFAIKTIYNVKLLCHTRNLPKKCFKAFLTATSFYVRLFIGWVLHCSTHSICVCWQRFHGEHAKKLIYERVRRRANSIEIKLNGSITLIDSFELTTLRLREIHFSCDLK